MTEERKGEEWEGMRGEGSGRHREDKDEAGGMERIQPHVYTVYGDGCLDGHHVTGSCVSTTTVRTYVCMYVYMYTHC